VFREDHSVLDLKTLISAGMAEPEDAPALGAGGCLLSRDNTHASSILAARTNSL
jgi:hypothetical protein